AHPSLPATQPVARPPGRVRGRPGAGGAVTAGTGHRTAPRQRRQHWPRARLRGGVPAGRKGDAVRGGVRSPELLPQLPDTLTVEVYDGRMEPPPGVEEVEFYVTPYTFAKEPLRLMAKMPRLQVVQTLTAGYEHILPYLPTGVTLCNAGRLHDTSTAELAVTLMLAALRGLPDFIRGQDAREWRHRRYRSLADRTVLIVGYGGIGAAIERRLAGFEVAE